MTLLEQIQPTPTANLIPPRNPYDCAKLALEQAGLKPDQVEHLLADFSVNRILLACDVYDWASTTLTPQGKPYAKDIGFLLAFLRRNWSTPFNYVPKQRRQAQSQPHPADP